MNRLRLPVQLSRQWVASDRHLFAHKKYSYPFLRFRAETFGKKKHRITQICHRNLICKYVSWRLPVFLKSKIDILCQIPCKFYFIVEDGKTCTVKVIIAPDALMLISKWLFFGLCTSPNRKDIQALPFVCDIFIFRQMCSYYYHSLFAVVLVFECHL